MKYSSSENPGGFLRRLIFEPQSSDILTLNNDHSLTLAGFRGGGPHHERITTAGDRHSAQLVRREEHLSHPQNSICAVSTAPHYVPTIAYRTAQGHDLSYFRHNALQQFPPYIVPTPPFPLTQLTPVLKFYSLRLPLLNVNSRCPASFPTIRIKETLLYNTS